MREIGTSVDNFRKLCFQTCGVLSSSGHIRLASRDILDMLSIYRRHYKPIGYFRSTLSLTSLLTRRLVRCWLGISSTQKFLW
jgi:hypothetical protein